MTWGLATGEKNTWPDRNLLGRQCSVVIDFNGLGVISSGFADEVFGRLFMDMGPLALMNRIEMRNVDSTVAGLIKRAIFQRTRPGNGGVRSKQPRRSNTGSPFLPRIAVKGQGLPSITISVHENHPARPHLWQSADNATGSREKITRIIGGGNREWRTR